MMNYDAMAANFHWSSLERQAATDVLQRHNFVRYRLYLSFSTCDQKWMKSFNKIDKKIHCAKFHMFVNGKRHPTTFGRAVRFGSFTALSLLVAISLCQHVIPWTPACGHTNRAAEPNITTCSSPASLHLRHNSALNISGGTHIN